MRQNSRKIWLHLGDGNTTFFFRSSIKIRQAKNCISQLYTDHGNRVTNTEDLRIMAPKISYNLFNQSDYFSVFPNLVVKKHLTSEAQN